MTWNWQQKEWPNFRWDNEKLSAAEQAFTRGSGIITGSKQHLDEEELNLLHVELLSTEAIDTSEIEGEILNRESVQASIRYELGLSAHPKKATPQEFGIAEMMTDLYENPNTPITEKRLFKWHRMLMNGRRDLEHVGGYRTHNEPMQIVSGPDYRRKIHFEAPPSNQVPQEMKRFLDWVQNQKLPPITKAGIAHLWFECIHPFEDGNGRIGRAISEKILSDNTADQPIVILAKSILKRKKAYYLELSKASKQLEISDWLAWFASIVLEAQQATVSYIKFIIQKTKLLTRLSDQLNPRQEKALLRLFREGPEGFTGGLSASNYRNITGATSATATRDLHDLVEKGALEKKGEKKATRYYLAIELEQG